MENFSEKAFFAELDGEVARVWINVLSANGCELAERVEGFKVSKAAANRLFAHAANGAELSEKALAVLREEGSGVALPEALGQLRDDMQQVTSRLGQAKADAQTVSLEEEIMAGLEEMIAAVKQAQRDQQSRPRAGQGGGEQEEAPLVDRLAELKMLRSLQLRVNARTKRYAQLVSGPVGQADEADLLDALKRLAEREARIYQATRDIVLEKNE